MESSQASPSEGDRTDAELEWSYRSHPVRVLDGPSGRALVHALYLLEADMLAEKSSAERLHLVIEATRRALRSEAAAEPIEARLGGPTPETVNATPLAATEAALDSGPTGEHGDVAAAALVCTGEMAVFGGPDGLPLILSRFGRPALGITMTGPGAVLRAARLLVQRIDGGASLDAVCRAAPMALGEGTEIRISPSVAESLRTALMAKGHDVREDGSLNDAAGCVGVALEDDGTVKGAGSGNAQVAQRAASSTSSQV